MRSFQERRFILYSLDGGDECQAVAPVRSAEPEEMETLKLDEVKAGDCAISVVDVAHFKTRTTSEGFSNP